MTCHHQFEIYQSSGGQSQRCKFCGIDAGVYQMNQDYIHGRTGCICPPGANLDCANPMCPRKAPNAGGIGAHVGSTP